MNSGGSGKGAQATEEHLRGSSTSPSPSLANPSDTELSWPGRWAGCTGAMTRHVLARGRRGHPEATAEFLERCPRALGSWGAGNVAAHRPATRPGPAHPRGALRISTPRGAAVVTGASGGDCRWGRGFVCGGWNVLA